MNVRTPLVTGLILACLGPPAARADIITIDPAGTYLRTMTDPSSTNALAINLSTLSFTATPGTLLRLDLVGGYNLNPSPQFDMVGVFSSSSALAASSNQNRVSGAIDAGIDYATMPTFFSALPTDITQDFAIARDTGTVFTGVTIAVPAGAAFLFVTPDDEFFGDNVPLAAGYRLSIQPVPEPGCVALCGLAAVGLAGRAVRKRKAATA